MSKNYSFFVVNNARKGEFSILSFISNIKIFHFHFPSYVSSDAIKLLNTTDWSSPKRDDCPQEKCFSEIDLSGRYDVDELLLQTEYDEGVDVVVDEVEGKLLLLLLLLLLLTRSELEA
jgi:hypothetical protein